MIEWTFSIHILEAVSCFLLGVVVAAVIFLIDLYKNPQFSDGWNAGLKYGKTIGVLKCKDCKFCVKEFDEDGNEFYVCRERRYYGRGRTVLSGFCDAGEPK